MASASSLSLTTICTVGSVPPVGSAEFFADPYPTYRLLREQGPIVRLGANMLACTRYADCLALLRDPRLSARRYLRPISHYTAAEQSQLATWIRIASNQVIFMDPPEHTRLRNLLMRAFSPEAIERLIPRIGAVFSKLLDAIPRCTEIDFMSRVAQRFPALVIGEVLGIPRSGWRHLLRWCDVFMDFFTSVPAPFQLALKAQEAVIELIEYAKPIVERRRRQPLDDLISMMLEAVQDSDEITTEELLAQCMLMLVAGYETMRNLLGNSLFTLLSNPSALERLRQSPMLVRGSAAEILRFQSPVQGISRIAAVPFELFGETLEPGQTLIILSGSANRDPRQFLKPDHFDIERRNNAHLTFGAGAHTCLGNYLARLEAQIALSMLLRRYSRITLCDPTPPWCHALLVRGLKSLNVVFE
jgi:cytochrome P450